MKGINARRIQVKLGEVWKSPNLHILLTEEDKVIVARCLDFTVSSHGQTEKDALQSLGEAIKEYLFNVIDLTNRFITRAEAPLLDAVLPWIFSARPDGFDGRDEQAVQFF